MKTHQAWNTLTHVVLELRGLFFTRAYYYIFCSCNEVLVKKCVKLEELLSVWLSLFLHLWTSCQSVLVHPLGFAAGYNKEWCFPGVFFNLWLPNFPFERQLAPLYITAKERWWEDVVGIVLWLFWFWNWGCRGIDPLQSCRGKSKIYSLRSVKLVTSSSDWREITILKLNYSLGFKSHVVWHLLILLTWWSMADYKCKMANDPA